MASVAVVRGRVLGFWLRYAMEQVCLVGFIRRRLVVHKFDRERHGLLGLEDLDTAVSHVSCKMLWSLDPTDKQACVTSDGGVHVRIFFIC